MIKYRSGLIRFLYIFIDALFVYGSFFLACLLRSDKLGFPVNFQTFFFDPANVFRFVFAFWLLLIILINHVHGLYQTRRELLEGVEIWLVAKANAIAALVVVVVLYILKIEGLPRTIFFISAVSIFISFSLWRLGKRLFVEYLVSHGYNNMNAVIVGAGRVGMALAQEIKKRPGLGVRVVGFLDDFKAEVGDGKLKILGKISDFAQIAQREFIHKLYITIHHDSQVFLKLLEQARDMDIRVRVVPQGYDLTSGNFLKYNIGLIPLLEYSEGQQIKKQAGKRIFDFFMSLLLLIILCPVFLIIALAIKLDSDGPIFYYSRRYGRRGKMFQMFKFRSMRKDADAMLTSLKVHNEVDGPIFKIKKDPRITAIGCILRKYSFDELPQLINVLLGDMSLVGPRPLPIEQIEKEDLRQLKRLEIRPGITGLWQIRGRSDLSFGRLVKWDIWYINNWSFWLDLTILVQTVPVILRAKGAY